MELDEGGKVGEDLPRCPFLLLPLLPCKTTRQILHFCGASSQMSPRVDNETLADRPPSFFSSGGAHTTCTGG